MSIHRHSQLVRMSKHLLGEIRATVTQFRCQQQSLQWTAQTWGNRFRTDRTPTAGGSAVAHTQYVSARTGPIASGPRLMRTPSSLTGCQSISNPHTHTNTNTNTNSSQPPPPSTVSNHRAESSHTYTYTYTTSTRTSTSTSTTTTTRISIIRIITTTTTTIPSQQ